MIDLLDEFDKKCKTAFFILVSEYGPLYEGNFQLSIDMLKAIFKQQRVTRKMLDTTRDFFENRGYKVEENASTLWLSLEAANFASTPDEMLQLATAISTFRRREAMNE